VTTLEGSPLAEAPGVGSLTLGGFLREVCGRFAANEALVFDDPLTGATVRWTYSELEAQSVRVAAALIAAGTARGARVGVLMGSRPEAVASFFGTALVGAVVVPLSTFSPPPELEYMLSKASVEVVLSQVTMRGRPLLDGLASLRERLPALKLVAAVSVPLEGGTPPGGWATRWEAFLASGENVAPGVVQARAVEVDPSDEGLIVYSSGTTDRPKGVVHPHRAPTLQFWLQARVFGRHQGTRMWTSLPMFWTAGINTAMGATLAAGGCWVMQESFQPGEALRLMERERVTEPYTLPHQTVALEEHPYWATTDLSSLRCVFGKSAFARHPTVSGDTSWNMPVAYGMSETCTGFVTHYCDSSRELLKASSGRLLPGNRLRVVDPDTGRPLGANETGELAVAGPTLMSHYLGSDPRECFDNDGFFHTGDTGYFDDEGYVHWTGRRSEMIKTGGASVSPAEIEVALRACPAVKLARVLGVPDARLGQLVVLCAVLKDGAAATPQDLQDFLRARVSSYKVPKRVLIFEDGEVPMTGSDTKVRDADLLRLVEARLAGESGGASPAAPEPPPTLPTGAAK
jgi:fatty-acyl-CoA synthase